MPNSDRSWLFEVDWLVLIDKAQNIREVEAIIQDYLEPLQVDIYSYHLLAANFQKFQFLESLKVVQFPDEWISEYAKADNFAIDPILEQTDQRARPFKWYDLEGNSNLTDKQQSYFARMRDRGIVDGWAMPVFGPKFVNGYCGFGSTLQTIDFNHEECIAVHNFCQRIHMRIFDFFTDSLEPKNKLTPREIQILKWVAKSNSNEDIATALNISNHTVNSHLRSIFKKFDATNRLEAVLHGYQQGLIKL